MKIDANLPLGRALPVESEKEKTGEDESMGLEKQVKGGKARCRDQTLKGKGVKKLHRGSSVRGKSVARRTPWTGGASTHPIPKGGFGRVEKERKATGPLGMEMEDRKVRLAQGDPTRRGGKPAMGRKKRSGRKVVVKYAFIAAKVKQEISIIFETPNEKAPIIGQSTQSHEKGGVGGRQMKT